VTWKRPATGWLRGVFILITIQILYGAWLLLPFVN
jgi:hypothetical protein